MPRYFFDLVGDINSLDDEGTECLDLHNAKIEAIRLMGEILRDNAETIFSIQDCRVMVRDNQGRPLSRVQTSVASPLETGAAFARPYGQAPGLTRMAQAIEQELALARPIMHR